MRSCNFSPGGSLNSAVLPCSKSFPPRKDHAEQTMHLGPISRSSTSLFDCRDNDMQRRNGDERLFAKGPNRCIGCHDHLSHQRCGRNARFGFIHASAPQRDSVPGPSGCRHRTLQPMLKATRRMTPESYQGLSWHWTLDGIADPTHGKNRQCRFKPLQSHGHRPGENAQRHNASYRADRYRRCFRRCHRLRDANSDSGGCW
jgi:hypothetical protein